MFVKSKVCDSPDDEQSKVCDSPDDEQSRNLDLYTKAEKCQLCLGTWRDFAEMKQRYMHAKSVVLLNI
jgi:hypothetical protein